MGIDHPRIESRLDQDPERPPPRYLLNYPIMVPHSTRQFSLRMPSIRFDHREEPGRAFPQTIHPDAAGCACGNRTHRQNSGTGNRSDRWFQTRDRSRRLV